MLRILGRRDSPEASVEIDSCVPFVLRLGAKPEAGESLQWYCREGNFSHFEIWLDRTGMIHRVALVSLGIRGRITESDKADDGPTVPTSGRVPVCDVARWSAVKVGENYNPLIEQHRFDFHIGGNFVSLRFYEAGEPGDWIVNHRSRFGVAANGCLCRVDLIGLAPRDISAIHESLSCGPKK